MDTSAALAAQSKRKEAQTVREGEASLTSGAVPVRISNADMPAVDSQRTRTKARARSARGLRRRARTLQQQQRLQEKLETEMHLLLPPLLPCWTRRSSQRRARKTRSSKRQSGKQSAMAWQQQLQLQQLYQPALPKSIDLKSRAQRRRRAR